MNPLDSNRNGQPRRARVRLRNGKLYQATVQLEGRWVHLTDAARLTHHMDGYAYTPIDDIAIAARDVERLRWLAETIA